MVVRIPHELVMWFPWLLFFGEVILVLTIGPRLIAAARRRRNLSPLPLSSRVGRCFIGSVLAILAWMIMLYVSAAIIFSSLGDEKHNILVIVFFCIALVIISFLTYLIPARICSGPMEVAKTAPRRRRYFIAPGLLILVCIWVFWGMFIPWMNHTFRSMYRSMNVYQLKGIGTGLSRYMESHQTYPDRLGQLVDNENSPYDFRLSGVNRRITPAEKVEGQSYRVPKEFHYIRLPDSAPKNSVWIWVDPTLYEGDLVPVLYKDGYADRVSPEVLCIKLFETYQWLLTPEASKSSEAKQTWNDIDQDYLRIRFPANVFVIFGVPILIVVVEIVIYFIAFHGRYRAEPNGKRNWNSAIFIVAMAIVFLLAVYNSMSIFSYKFQQAYDTANLRGISSALSSYAQSHSNEPPKRLGQLVESGDASPILFRVVTIDNSNVPDYEEGKTFETPKEFRYLRLPDDAPGDMVCIWLDPFVYKGNQSPIVYHDGHVEWLWPEEIAEEIGHTYEWLLEHRGTSETMPASTPSKKQSPR